MCVGKPVYLLPVCVQHTQVSPSSHDWRTCETPCSHGMTHMTHMHPPPHMARVPLEHGWQKRCDRCGPFLFAPLGAFASLVVARAPT